MTRRYFQALVLVLALGSTTSAQRGLTTTTTTTTATFSGGTTASTSTRTGTITTAVPPSPEQEAGCTIPTLQQCQDPAYIDTRCGQLQAENEWTCATLIDDAMSALGDDAVPEAVPWSMASEGVARTVDGGSMSVGDHYVADPLAIGSAYVAAEYGGAIPVGSTGAVNLTVGDVYDAWATSATFQSCQEHVYERWYPIHELLRTLGAEARDPLRVVQVAFGPADDPASFGTNHLMSLAVHDLAGEHVMTLPYDSYDRGPLDHRLAKNAFFWLPAFQATTEIPDPGPDLHASIRAYSAAGDAFLDLIESARAEDAPGSQHYVDEVYPRRLAYDRWWYEHALYEGPRAAPFGGKVIDDAFLPGTGGEDGDGLVFDGADDLLQNDDEPTAAELLGTVASVPGMRRYLAAELDELYAVQQRLLDLARRWYALNFRFEGSGWQPSELEPEGHDTPGGLITRSPSRDDGGDYTTLVGGGTSSLDDYAAEGGGDDDGGAIGGGATFELVAADSSETALRRALVAEMVALLSRAAEAGCLEPGITPCDWSPAKLADRLLRRPDRQREQAFRSCQRLVDGIADGSTHAPTNGLMMNMLGEVFEFESPSGQEVCEVAVPSSLSTDDLSTLREQLRECRELQAAGEIETYVATIRETTDLYDSASGEIRNPGFRRSREEQMGNDYFGLSYAYDYGYELDLSDGVCAPEIFLGGEFSAGLDVLTHHVELIDVAARIDSNEATNDDLLVDVHADVLGQPIFDPVSIGDQGLGGETYDWSTVVEGSHEFDQTLATARFVIVFVPVSISAGVGAELGFRAEPRVLATGFGTPGECPSLEVGGTLTPFAGARGFVEAGVDIGIASAGLRGELSLLDALLPFETTLTIETDAEVQGDYDNLAATALLTVDVDAKLKLRTLDGSISAYAEAGICPFCVRASVDIIDWRGPSWDETLYHGNWSLELGMLAAIRGEE